MTTKADKPESFTCGCGKTHPTWVEASACATRAEACPVFVAEIVEALRDAQRDPEFLVRYLDAADFIEREFGGSQ